MTYITNKSYFHEVSAGRVAGSTADVLIGFSFSVTPDVEFEITDVPDVIPRPSAAETLKVTSTNTADDDGNTGMRSIIINGLDVNFESVSALVTLDGTSSVSTTQTFIRVHEIFGITAGSEKTNLGIISIVGNTSDDTYGTILPGVGASRIATRTIPAGKNGIVLGSTWDVARQSGGAMPKVNVKAFVKLTGLSADSPWIQGFSSIIDSSVTNEIAIEGPTGLLLPEKTDLRFTWEPDTRNVAINFRSWLVLEDV